MTGPFGPIRPARRDGDPDDPAPAGDPASNGHIPTDDLTDLGDHTGDDARYEPLTDLGNARRLVATHGHRLRYIPVWRRWLIWDGTRWAYDDTGQVWRCAKHVARSMLHSAATAETTEDRDRLIAAARRAESARGIHAMVDLAGTEKTIALTPSQLDADPYLLNAANGTIDLRTGRLHPHNPDSHITKVCRAAYHPDADAPRFTAFLQRVQPDTEMRTYLARLLGYGLLGLVLEHIMPIFYGGGGNGKGTLLETIAAVLGDYASAVDPELLVATKHGAHPTGAADLFGLRLALAQETDSGRRLAEGTVKRLTGGDTIKARRMREDFWAFEPSHLVVMQTNHRPVITGTDEGIWRRVTLVPFDVKIPDNERDPELRSRLLLEADGILAWLLGGYRDYDTTGLAPPEPVRAATAEYRASSDDLGRFIDDRCLTGPHFYARSDDLFSAWCGWCAGENIDPKTKTAFGRLLTDRGLDSGKRQGHRTWFGIALAGDEEP